MSTDTTDMKKLLHDVNQSIAQDPSYPLNDFSKMKVGGKKMSEEEKRSLFSDIKNISVSSIPVADADGEIPPEVAQAAINKQRSIVAQLRQNSTRESLSKVNSTQSRAFDSVLGSGSLPQRDAASYLTEAHREAIQIENGIGKTNPNPAIAADDVGEYESVKISTPETSLPPVGSSSEDEFEPVGL